MLLDYRRAAAFPSALALLGTSRRKVGSRQRRVAFVLLRHLNADQGGARRAMPEKRFCLFGIVVAFLLVPALECQAGAQPTGTKSLHAFLATKQGGKRTTVFSADVPTIYLFWKGEGFQVGDKVSGVWIAENVGAGAKETEIRRADYKVYKPTEEGGFSLGRPAGRTWPLGKYRVDLYINGAIAEVVKFTVQPGVTVEVQ